MRDGEGRGSRPLKRLDDALLSLAVIDAAHRSGEAGGWVAVRI